MFSILIQADILNSKVIAFIENKYNTIEQLKNAIEVNNKFINNRIQIMKDNKIVDIQSLKKGDSIVISDLKHSKNALIT